MSITIECEIKQVIKDLKLEKKVEIFVGEEREQILLKLKNIFVCGNPRVWWLSLKWKPRSLFFEGETYKDLSNHFSEEEEVWFVIEEDEQLLYRTKISCVISIIENCSLFEYNVISKDLKRFICETDHDDILYIDLREVENN